MIRISSKCEAPLERVRTFNKESRALRATTRRVSRYATSAAFDQNHASPSFSEDASRLAGRIDSRSSLTESASVCFRVCLTLTNNAHHSWFSLCFRRRLDCESECTYNRVAEKFHFRGMAMRRRRSPLLVPEPNLPRAPTALFVISHACGARTATNLTRSRDNDDKVEERPLQR